MIDLKFYANKRGHYNNKYFFFKVKRPIDAISLLYHFKLHNNFFIRIYFFNHLTNSNIELPHTLVDNFALTEQHFKCS
jgi:hypothetical protein